MEWIKAAKVGDKVVCCIGDGVVRCKPLDVNSIYTVREIAEWKGTIGVRLAEVRNALDPFDFEYSYLPSRFRPVQPRKTDINMFTDILKKASNPIKETA